MIFAKTKGASDVGLVIFDKHWVEISYSVVRSLLVLCY